MPTPKFTIRVLLFLAVILNGCSSGPKMELLSVDKDGVKADLEFRSAVLSRDGQHMAFTAKGTGLAADGSDEFFQVYVRNLKDGSTVLASRTDSGEVAGGHCSHPSLSDDGKVVAFSSRAKNMGANGKFSQIFARDISQNKTYLASANADGKLGNGHSGSPSVSGDGKSVVFKSEARNLIKGVKSKGGGVYLKGLGGPISLVSVGNEDKKSKSGFGPHVAVSKDGRFVAFSGRANCFGGSKDEHNAVFVRDTHSRTTEIASSTASGSVGNGSSSNPFLSSDGRYILFRSRASNLVEGVKKGSDEHLYLVDREKGEPVLVNRSFDGSTAKEGIESRFTVSDDGRYVAFCSHSGDLVAEDGNRKSDVFVRDLKKGTTTLVSVGLEGKLANGVSSSPSISADGSVVLFSSSASNLVEGDSGRGDDVFLSRL